VHPCGPGLRTTIRPRAIATGLAGGGITPTG